MEDFEIVGKSYDKTIELGAKGIDPYKDLPEWIKADPDYPAFERARNDGGDSGSDDPRIKAFLNPSAGERFVDLGCSLNLMLRGYDAWPSEYHGVDVSAKTIELLKGFVAKNNLTVGALINGSLHETPFEADYFDIGACVGSLEYFKKDFVEKALSEFNRILKPSGRFVLDIPNITSPMRRFMNILEEYQGRPDKFDISPDEFEAMLRPFFSFERVDYDGVAMIQYYLTKKEMKKEPNKYKELEPYLESGLIGVLQKAQGLYGWLSEDLLAHVAEKTGQSRAKVYGVATFYAQFRLKPMGRRHILLCQGTACHVNGSAEIEEAVREELGVSEGETTADGIFSYNNVACLGCCSLSPAMMIDGKAYGSLTPGKAKAIIREIRKEETV
ncbi:MAG: NADH-quinone oxidoreductase subunit NuoE [Clostridiales bacterium]|nr:NADH-quinone oxidoreductase subunit NuoE [Clostridiales bacterium]